MQNSSLNTGLTDLKIESAIGQVNSQGYAALKLHSEVLEKLGESLYRAIDAVTFHRQRLSYYNEIAFYWPEDWRDIDEGIATFHERKSLANILDATTAKKLLDEKIGEIHSAAIFDFASEIKRLIVKYHHGLNNNELRLARVMVRQMNENQITKHSGSETHEDIGYSDRPYQQLLSAIVTTFGLPTEAERYRAEVGELLIFNAYDRRRLLRMSDDLAFIHKGPKSGPKMFFFFEFLGPST